MNIFTFTISFEVGKYLVALQAGSSKQEDDFLIDIYITSSPALGPRWFQFKPRIKWIFTPICHVLGHERAKIPNRCKRCSGKIPPPKLTVVPGVYVCSLCEYQASTQIQVDLHILSRHQDGIPAAKNTANC